MIKKYILILLMLPVLADAQTLYVPGNTSGIGPSVNGNVGIGTNTPLDALHVAGDVRLSSRLYFTTANAHTGGSYGVIGLLTGTPGKNFVFYNYDGPVNELMTLNGTTGSVAINNGGLFVNGRVGIGTSNPASKLHVDGGHIYIGPLTGTMTGIGRMSISGAGAEISIVNRSATSFVEVPTQGERWVIYNEGPANDGKLRFWSGNDKMILTKEGRLGIGTANPDAALTVNGNIHTKEVQVDMTVPGPDYVFEKDYNLLPLSELEAYISQNKHLPEVPSAKEMEANGLNLKEMNLLLLKKVEELTLHLIEANKKIESLDKQVQSLKNNSK